MPSDGSLLEAPDGWTSLPEVPPNAWIAPSLPELLPAVQIRASQTSSQEPNGRFLTPRVASLGLSLPHQQLPCLSARVRMTYNMDDPLRSLTPYLAFIHPSPAPFSIVTTSHFSIYHLDQIIDGYIFTSYSLPTPIMKHNLTSRFSDSTIASASSSFSKVSSASSASSVEDLLLPSFDAIPKPPPRTSSITLNSTKTYSERRERKKPAPLQLVASKRSTRRAEPAQSSASSSDDEAEERYFSCTENERDSKPCHRPKCFCGSSVRASTDVIPSSSGTEIYCSRECARQDALYALEGRSPISSPLSTPYSEYDEEDEDFPVTPTNAFVPSPPRTPVAKGRVLGRHLNPSLTRKLTGLGASHYRRMEALGLYDADSTPTRPSKSSLLLDPIDLIVAHSPPSKAARLHSSVADDDDSEELDFNPRKTLFFPVPIYMGSPVQS